MLESEDAPLLRPAPRSRSRGVAAICACALLLVAAATRGSTPPARLVADGVERHGARGIGNPNATVGPRVIASLLPQNQSAGEAEHPDYPDRRRRGIPSCRPRRRIRPRSPAAPAPTTYDSPSYAPSLPHPLAREPDAAAARQWMGQRRRCHALTVAADDGNTDRLPLQ